LDDSPAGRSAEIQRAAEALHERGAIVGWRDERYRCERPLADPCAEFGSELFSLERAAFRFFGLMSRAVHINGLRGDGSVWCGRRALHKPTDPGRLDNLAAGGLGAGEALLDCARRELFEEAGVHLALTASLRPQGALRVTRLEPEGLHDEVLHVYQLQLPDDFRPANQDGEVSEFLLLSARELLQRLDEFTPDAAAVMRASLLRGLA
jgi:8-oxo-dGTP pyrophosphatase MutT (NUDIX family)